MLNVAMAESPYLQPFFSGTYGALKPEFLALREDLCRSLPPRPLNIFLVPFSYRPYYNWTGGYGNETVFTGLLPDVFTLLSDLACTPMQLTAGPDVDAEQFHNGIFVPPDFDGLITSSAEPMNDNSSLIALSPLVYTQVTGLVRRESSREGIFAGVFGPFTPLFSPSTATRCR